MPRRPALVVVLCVAFSGCLGAVPGSSQTPTPTASAGTDCPPTLTVYELGEEPADRDDAVAYGNLTADQQATFDRARDGGTETFAYEWHDIDVVEYEGTYYRAGIVVC